MTNCNGLGSEELTMAWIPSELANAKSKISTDGVVTATVRDLLHWFGAYRRSWRNVAMIREPRRQHEGEEEALERETAAGRRIGSRGHGVYRNRPT